MTKKTSAKAPELAAPQFAERQVPLGAMRFAAEIEIDAPADGEEKSSKNTVYRITARTGKAVFHWYWGKVIHDLRGMKTNKPRIPLDYCHDPADVVGYADGFDVSSGDLVVAGTLTPFQPTDRASEIIHKKAEGVPYEASIFFDPFELVVEEVSAGAVVIVNGNEFHGPGAIIRQWTLRGLAVCPYGTDQLTSVEFSSDRPDVTVRTLSPQEPTVKKTALSGKTKPAKAAKTAKPSRTNPQTSLAAEDDKADDKKEEGEQSAEECDCAGEEDCECDKDDEESGDEAGEQAAAAGPGARFLSAFGDQGGVWFAQGKTFEEAQALHTQHLQAQNTKLAAEADELRSKLKLAAGEQQPVGFSAPAPSAADKARAQLETKIGSKGLAAFAAGIKLPGQS